jgi:hypothetical protein
LKNKSLLSSARFISAVENKRVAIAALGEGWHNYHHVFPWDYKTSELGFYTVNLTTMFIDSMAYIGQAYDLKTVSKEMILARVNRTGDGTHYTHNPELQQQQATPPAKVNQLAKDKAVEVSEDGLKRRFVS